MTRNLVISAAVTLAFVSAAAAQQAAEKKAAPAPPPPGVAKVQIRAVPIAPAAPVVVIPFVKAQVKAEAVAKGKEAAKGKAEVLQKKAAAPAVKLAVPAVQARQVQGQAFMMVDGQMVPMGGQPGQPPDPIAVATQPLFQLNPNAIDSSTYNYMMQLRPTLRAEYEFLIGVCQPDKDQKRHIARAGESSLRRFAEITLGRTPRPPGFPNTANGGSIGREYFRDDLGRAARACLSPREVARYESELQERVSLRDDAVIKGAVALLDFRLYLSPDQRQSLETKLRAEWKNTPEPEAIDMYMANSQNPYVPIFPNNLVESVLDADQKVVYGALQRVSYGVGINDDGRNDIPLEDAELPPYTIKPDGPPAARNGIIQRARAFIAQ